MQGTSIMDPAWLLPTQGLLDSLLERTTRFRVIGAGMVGGRALWGPVFVDTSAPNHLAGLRSKLTIIEPSRFFCCMCDGAPTFELYEGKALRGAIALHHGQSIRCSLWESHALLANLQAFIAWMSEIGAGPEREREEALGHQQAAAARWQRWRAATPASLVPFRVALDRGGPYDIAAMLQAMRRESAQAGDDVRALFAWFGATATSWDVVNYYEELTEELLAAHPVQELIAALEGRALSETEAEGAARYFGRRPRPNRPIPVGGMSPALRSLLLEAGSRTTDPYRLASVKAAFVSQ